MAQPRAKHFFEEKILMPGGFTPPEQIQSEGVPPGAGGPWGRCDIDKPRNLAKSVTVE